MSISRRQKFQSVISAAVFLSGLLIPLSFSAQSRVDTSQESMKCETVVVYIDLTDAAVKYSSDLNRTQTILKYCPKMSEWEASIYLYAAYKVGNEYNIDPDLLIALAIVETGMQNLTSNKNAEGFTQIISKFWLKYCDFPDDPKRDLYNPIKAFKITAQILTIDKFSLARYSGYAKRYSRRVERIQRELKSGSLVAEKYF